MMKIFTRVQKIDWISHKKFNYLIIQTYIPKVIFMFPQVCKKLTSKKLFSLNSIKLYNWCSNKKPKIKSLDKNHLLISCQKTEWEFCLRLSEWEAKKEEIGEMSSWDRLEIQGDFLFSNPNSFFGFIKGTSKNKVTQFFKASASPSASQQKLKFPMVPNKSLAPWFCSPCVP